MEDDTCSFCLGSEGTVLAGPPSVFICNHCLDLCTDIFGDEGRPVGPDLVCSFCGMNQRRRLVAGPRVYICDECVDRFNATLALEGEK